MNVTTDWKNTQSSDFFVFVLYLYLKLEPLQDSSVLWIAFGSSASLKKAWYSTHIFQNDLQTSRLAMENSSVSLQEGWIDITQHLIIWLINTYIPHTVECLKNAVIQYPGRLLRFSPQLCRVVWWGNVCVWSSTCGFWPSWKCWSWCFPEKSQRKKLV